MPRSLRRRTVTAILERHEGLVRCEVDGRPCAALPRLTGPVALGDEVLVEGGVVYANLTRGLGLPADEAPYAEQTDPLAETLAGMPVVCCPVHEQLEPVCTGIGVGVRVAYVQLPGGALATSLSDSVRVLQERGLIEAAVATGAHAEGAVRCVNVHSALAWAAAGGFAVVVCAPGPGLADTGSSLGHGAVAAADAANGTSALEGSPILAAHHDDDGVSRYTRAAFELCLGSVAVAWPTGLRAPTWLEPREEIDVPEDAHADRCSFAAGLLARGLLV